MAPLFDYENVERPGVFVDGKISVMFTDIVRFTKFGDNEALREAVRALQNAITDIFRDVEWDRTSKIEPNGVIMISTGDGYGIGFEPSLVKDRKVLDYAVELSNRMKKEEKPIRIGINNGSCYIHKDANGFMNLCGWGVIDAERVMSLGGKNHILCERSFAKSLLDDKDDPNLRPPRQGALIRFLLRRRSYTDRSEKQRAQSRSSMFHRMR